MISRMTRRRGLSLAVAACLCVLVLNTSASAEERHGHPGTAARSWPGGRERGDRIALPVVRASERLQISVVAAQHHEWQWEWKDLAPLVEIAGAAVIDRFTRLVTGQDQQRVEEGVASQQSREDVGPV